MNDSIPSGTFEGTIEQTDSPLRVKYIVEEDTDIQPEVIDLHLELSLPPAKWSRRGTCIVKDIDLREEVVFSGCGDRVTMLSLLNPQLGVLHFIWDSTERTLCGGDEFWEPGLEPTIITRQASNAHLGSGEKDEIRKADTANCKSRGGDLEATQGTSNSSNTKAALYDLRLKSDPETREGNPASDTCIGLDQLPSNAVLAARGELRALKMAYLTYDKEEHDDLLRNACANGHAETVAWLLTRGPGSEDLYFDAFSCRCFQDGAAVVRELKAKIPCSESALSHCAAVNNVVAMKSLLPFPGSLTAAVVSASKNGRTAVLQLLLEAKANPNTGYPLHAACKSGRMSAIRTLAPLASCDEIDEDGHTPLDYLRIYSHDHLVPVLQEARTARRRIR